MNIGLAYYKEYYRNADLRPERNDQEAYNKDAVKAMNDQLISASLEGIKSRIDIMPHEIVNKSFELKTTYPGLLAGSGYLHEFSIEEALMLGFSFDHSSGLPCIPASSVKGLLRYACEVSNGAYLRQLVGEVVPVLIGFEPKRFVEEVFDGTTGDSRIGIYQRDIFFDAMPIWSLNNNANFMGEDFITPHLNRDDRELDGLKNPVPLKFLKVLPEVTFQFSFQLRGEKAGLSAQNREDLFKKILLELGIGAKTNVGYGQFVEETEQEKEEREKKELLLKQQLEEKNRKEKEEKEKEEKERAEEAFDKSFEEIVPDVTIAEGKEITDCVIFKIVKSRYFISYKYEGKNCQLMRLKKKIEFTTEPKERDRVTLKLTNPFNSGDKKLLAKAKIQKC